MSPDPTALNPIPTPALVVEAPRRRRFGWLVAMAALVIVAAAGTWASGSGSSLKGLFVEEPAQLPLFEVDQGSIVSYLVETGSLESANNTSIKCQVESLLGTTGGAAGTGRTGSTGSSGSSGSAQGSSGGATYGSSTASSGGTSGAGSAAASKKAGTGASKKGTTATANSKAMTGTGSSSSSGGSSASSGGSGGSSASSSGSSASSTSSSGSTTTGTQRPTVRSFSYDIPKYVPLRGSATPKSAAAKANTTASASSGGGRGGRGGGGVSEEKAGSTRIIWLKPEGADVKRGEVVCELDSSAFKDELQAERIRWLQAKSWVEQAKEIHEFNGLIYREYREGIYPQDMQVIRQYIRSCETDYERAVKTEAWSREVYEKRYRASAQYEADRVTVEQTALALKEARGMEERLVKFTGPRLLKSMSAKLKSIESDWLAQRASFEVEDDRLRRLEKMVANCTIRAPADGILVYNNQSNGWSGQVETQIQEGVTVREGQTLFDLPDPKRMRVKVKINESKMASVRPGQRAQIVVEAFAGRTLTGTVAEITPIPATQNRFSDIKIYFAIVNIDAGFEGLRPGMTARVTFLIADDAKATRVPLRALRWSYGRPFVAVAARVDGETRWDWRPVTLGLMDPNYAEVVKGLTPGEKVVATPDALPEPEPDGPPAGPEVAAAPTPNTQGG